MLAAGEEGADGPRVARRELDSQRVFASLTDALTLSPSHSLTLPLSPSLPRAHSLTLALTLSPSHSRASSHTLSRALIHGARLHPGVELRANLQSISPRCHHLFEVAFVWEWTKKNHPFAPELPPGPLQPRSVTTALCPLAAASLRGVSPSCRFNLVSPLIDLFSPPN